MDNSNNNTKKFVQGLETYNNSKKPRRGFEPPSYVIDLAVIAAVAVGGWLVYKHFTKKKKPACVSDAECVETHGVGWTCQSGVCVPPGAADFSLSVNCNYNNQGYAAATITNTGESPQEVWLGMSLCDGSHSGAGCNLGCATGVVIKDWDPVSYTINPGQPVTHVTAETIQSVLSAANKNPGDYSVIAKLRSCNPPPTPDTCCIIGTHCVFKYKDVNVSADCSSDYGKANVSNVGYGDAEVWVGLTICSAVGGSGCPIDGVGGLNCLEAGNVVKDWPFIRKVISSGNTVTVVSPTKISDEMAGQPSGTYYLLSGVYGKAGGADCIEKDYCTFSWDPFGSLSVSAECNRTHEGTPGHGAAVVTNNSDHEISVWVGMSLCYSGSGGSGCTLYCDGAAPGVDWDDWDTYYMTIPAHSSRDVATYEQLCNVAVPRTGYFHFIAKIWDNNPDVDPENSTCLDGDVCTLYC